MNRTGQSGVNSTEENHVREDELAIAALSGKPAGINYPIIEGVAQSVEQRTFNP